METIEVRYKPIGFDLYHKYIVWTDSNGNEWYARGGPSIKNNIADIRPGAPMGMIAVEHGIYQLGTPDWVSDAAIVGSDDTAGIAANDHQLEVVRLAA